MMIAVLFDGEDGGSLALQLAAQMPPQLQPVGDEVQHRDDARVVDARQPVEFLHDGNALRLVIGAAYQVGDAVNHHQMDAPVLVMEPVHAEHDGLQPLLAAHPRQAICLEPLRHRVAPAAAQQSTYVLV